VGVGAAVGVCSRGKGRKLRPRKVVPQAVRYREGGVVDEPPPPPGAGVGTAVDWLPARTAGGGGGVEDVNRSTTGS
jgi:hypothetical protein